MANRRNTLTLLGGEGREQSTGSAEKNILIFPFCHLAQKITAEYHRTAAAAGTACVDILFLQVKDHGAAIIVNAANAYTVSAEQIQQDLLAYQTQIAGDDEIIVGRGQVQIVKMGSDGFISGRRHGSAHIIGIGDTLIYYRSRGCCIDIRSVVTEPQKDAPGTGDSPLCRRRPLTAIAQREAVLPLR